MIYALSYGLISYSELRLFKSVTVVRVFNLLAYRIVSFAKLIIHFMFAYGLRDTDLNGEAAINPIIQY
jgi:hypothetical protein